MGAFDNMKAQTLLLGTRNDDKIRKTLKIVGLSERNRKYVKNYSLGMTQRLKLGMALLENPDILILDEPANGLDPDGIVELRELLIRLNRENGITILVSSHILSELGQISTCLGILHDGKIVKEISDSDILQNKTDLEKLYMTYTKGGNGFD
jgi:ABC-type multidrug transport system ATPase subunit